MGCWRAGSAVWCAVCVWQGHSRSAAPLVSLYSSTQPAHCPRPLPLPAAPRCSPHTELAAYTTEHPVYRHINMRMQVRAAPPLWALEWGMHSMGKSQIESN